LLRRGGPAAATSRRRGLRWACRAVRRGAETASGSGARKAYAEGRHPARPSQTALRSASVVPGTAGGWPAFSCSSGAHGGPGRQDGASRGFHALVCGR
jgi:hypothetical protein